MQRTPRTRHTSSAFSATNVGAERSCQGPFLGDRGLNSAGRFRSAIAESNLPAAPWFWRHSLIDEHPPVGAKAGALPCPAIVQSNDEHIGRRGPRRLRSPGLAKGKEYLIRTRRAWRHHLTYALAFSRRAGGASELPDLARAHSARSEKIEFSPGNSLLQRALPRRAVGCAFSGGPAKLLPQSFIRRRRYRCSQRRCTGSAHHTECCQCRNSRAAGGSMPCPPGS